jgi:hypothetical protein
LAALDERISSASIRKSCASTDGATTRIGDWYSEFRAHPRRGIDSYNLCQPRTIVTRSKAMRKWRTVGVARYP